MDDSLPGTLLLVAEQLRKLTDDPDALSALRVRLRELRADTDVHARRAGTLWAAGLGALLDLADGVEPGDKLNQALTLLGEGTDAWLQLAGETARETAEQQRRRAPLDSHVFDELGGISTAAREALRGDASAKRRIQRGVQTVRRSLRALKVQDGTP